MKAPRAFRYLALTALAGALAFVAGSAFFAWQFTGPARRPLGDKAERFLAAFENAEFPARDGVRLSGWFVPCAGARQAVVLLHGFGSTRTQMLARARLLYEHGYATLLYDARAHGTSAGDQVSFGWFETRDLLGALDWLRTRGFSEFGCIGASQGGATIALAAPELRDVKWVVLESTYPTLLNAVDRRFRRSVYLPGWLAGSALIPIAEWRLGLKAETVSPRDAIVALACPVLVMTGEQDTHTLPSDTREIFDRAREPKSWWLVSGAAHVDLYGFAKGEYERSVLEFIARSEKTLSQSR